MEHQPLFNSCKVHPLDKIGLEDIELDMNHFNILQQMLKYCKIEIKEAEMSLQDVE